VIYDTYMRTRLSVALTIAAVSLVASLFQLTLVYGQAQTTSKSNVGIPVIRITQDAKLYLNGTRVYINVLADQVRRGFPTVVEVEVRPDNDAVWEPVSQVLATLREARLTARFAYAEDPK
jgi:biopolymer transport protein ExbD